MIEELKRDLNVADEDARKSSHDVISYKTKGGRNNGILTKNRQAESRIKALEEDTSFVDKAFARDDNFGVEDDNILGTITEDKFPSVQLLHFNDTGALKTFRLTPVFKTFEAPVELQMCPRSAPAHAIYYPQIACVRRRNAVTKA